MFPFFSDASCIALILLELASVFLSASACLAKDFKSKLCFVSTGIGDVWKVTFFVLEAVGVDGVNSLEALGRLAECFGWRTVKRSSREDSESPSSSSELLTIRSGALFEIVALVGDCGIAYGSEGLLECRDKLEI